MTTKTKIVLLEICRTPEDTEKQTETRILHRCFTDMGIEHQVYSNDSIWPDPIQLDKHTVSRLLDDTNIRIVHLAVHGNDQGLVIRWSSHERIEDRVPEITMSATEILTMPAWAGKLVVSGACASATLADVFRQAGAAAMVAPTAEVSSYNLGWFFEIFYKGLLSGHRVKQALDSAVAIYPQYSCYRVY